MLERQKAIVFIFLTAILWSTGGFLIKSVQMNPVAIAGYRSLIAAIFLSMFLRDMNTKNLNIVITGALFYAATVILFVVSNKLTTAANVILLQYSAPIWVALLGVWFLREKVNLIDWFFILALLSGIFLFFFDKLTLSGKWGNILAILSGVSFAGTVLHMRKLKDSSSLFMIVLGNCFAALACSPYLIKSNGIGDHLLILIILGVFQLGLPYILYSKAIKSVRAIEAILISSIEVILNPLWVFILFSEKPGKWAVIGGIIVFSSVTFYGVNVSLRGNLKNQVAIQYRESIGK